MAKEVDKVLKLQIRGGAATNSRLDWLVSYEIIS